MTPSQVANDFACNKNFKCLTFLALLFLTADLASLVLTYKFIKIGPIYFSAEALIFPLTYTVTDIITEVYGYKKAKDIILLVFLFDFIFALLMFILIKTPSPNLELQKTYDYVFQDLLRGTLAEVVGVLSGIFVNIYAISKFRILTRGKYFWLRCIGSTLIGEAVLVLISMPILFLGRAEAESIWVIMICNYLYKIIFAIAIAYPATVAVNIIKNIEQIDDFDFNVKFNPFREFREEKSNG